MTRTLRAFIAIQIPPAGLPHLEATIGRLQGQGVSGVGWVRPEGIHLTLKFLGNVYSDKVDPILQAMARAVEGCRPFELGLAGLGAFPNVQKARVIWVGVQGALGSLLPLQARVEGEMAPLGFPPESRPFSPHLTLGRVRQGSRPPDPTTLEQVLANATLKEEFSWRVDQVCLIRSTLLPSGARYDMLGAVGLQES